MDKELQHTTEDIPLVTGLDFAEEQLAIADNSTDQVVATSLITVSCIQDSKFRQAADCMSCKVARPALMIVANVYLKLCIDEISPLLLLHCNQIWICDMRRS